MSHAHIVAIGFTTADGRQTWQTQHVFGFGSSPTNDAAVKAAALAQTTPFVRSALRYVDLDVRPDGSGVVGELWTASEAIRAPLNRYPFGRF